MLTLGMAFAVRCLLVALFLPFSALDKLLNFSPAVRQASAVANRRPAAVALIVAGFTVEVVMSGAILAGIADRLAAFILAGYCVATALMWKRFWKASDFKLAGPSQGREIFWDFLKNLALGGGFLLLAFGTDAAGVESFLHHPLASTNPYDTDASQPSTRTSP
jgi:putative oxidoreductase